MCFSAKTLVHYVLKSRMRFKLQVKLKETENKLRPNENVRGARLAKRNEAEEINI